MNKLKIAVFSLLVMFLFTGCAVKKNNEALIKVNNTVITKSEYDKAFDTVVSNNMLNQAGVDLKENPDDVLALVAKEQVVSELIVKSLLNEEMKKNKITVSKEDIENAEKEVMDRFGSKDQFLQILKMNGVTYDKFKKDLEEEIKMKKFVDSIAMVSIGESEAKKFYDENHDKFSYPDKVRASHILISSNPAQIRAKLKAENKDITDEDLEQKTREIMEKNLQKADEILAKVKQTPSNFAKIAKENSHDTSSAIRGGDLGFFAREEMVEPFANKAFEMAPNTISEIIQTPYGYHIIMVTDRAEAGVLSFEQSKKDIIGYLENMDKVSILRNKIDSLRNDAVIEYYDESYNPDNIQKKIKESSKDNPELQNEFGRQNEENEAQ